MTARIDGFSKLSKGDKIDWIVTNFTHDPEGFKKLLKQYWNDEPELQRIMTNLQRIPSLIFISPWVLPLTFLSTTKYMPYPWP